MIATQATASNTERRLDAGTLPEPGQMRRPDRHLRARHICGLPRTLPGRPDSR